MSQQNIKFMQYTARYIEVSYHYSDVTEFSFSLHKASLQSYISLRNVFKLRIHVTAESLAMN